MFHFRTDWFRLDGGLWRCAYMHITGRAALHPPSTVVGRMMVVAADSLREASGPSRGARVVMKAVHVEGLSFLVRVVSYHACGGHKCMSGQAKPAA